MGTDSISIFAIFNTGFYIKYINYNCQEKNARAADGGGSSGLATSAAFRNMILFIGADMLIFN